MLFCESLPLEGVNSHHTYSSLSHNSTLSIMYFNARSVFHKLDNLKLVCAIHHPDVICIVESWLDKEISDSELSLDGYNVSRVNRNIHGGGVLIEIYSCTQSCFNGNCDLELLIVSVSNSCNRQCCIGVLYRPPDSNHSVLDNVNHVLCTMDHTLFSNFVLLGDFNIDYNNTSHPFHHHLLGFMSTLCLTQVVSEPTRLSSHSSTLIDLVLLSQPPLLISCHTIPPLANSDHLGIHLKLKTRKQKSNIHVERYGDTLMLTFPKLTTYWMSWTLDRSLSQVILTRAGLIGEKCSCQLWTCAFPMLPFQLENRFHG